MFCTNCGFENPAAHRFCGMCGMPLPQRPITAPGAQSTADLTRHPVEVTQTTPSTGASPYGATTVQIPETSTSVASGPNYFSQAEEAASLEQFIAGFRYTPPTEEDEVTMTGDRPVLDPATKYEPAAPISVSEEHAAVAESSANRDESLPMAGTGLDDAAAENTPEQPAAVATEPPPFATKGMREQSSERSRFLDFSEQEQEQQTEAAPSAASSSIGGPSFLGLSDTPATPAYVGEGPVQQSHWRAWAAVIVILIFAGLGALEWRAEKNQTSNGPIGIMRMQIDRLKGKKAAVITPAPEAATEPTQPGSTSQPSGSGPEIQVAPQPKPQTNAPQPANGAAPAAPGAASSTPAGAPLDKKAQTEKSGVPGKQAAGEQQTQAAKSPEAETNSPAQTAEATESKSEKPAKAAPGAEELAKAANASDAPAASAWLWKSVAKGNPEAPVKLANMYIKGEGVPQNCEQAVVLLRSAAAKENAPARSRLGALYATGTCVQRNRVKAYEYVNQALQANPNAVWARDFRQQLWQQMTPQERQQAKKAQ